MLRERFDRLDPAEIAQRLLPARRLLLVGAQGAGKTTFAAALAAALAARGHACWGLSADPGSPGFGVPGALALARWTARGWRAEGLQALCSLDAARFRLPLVAAVERLLAAVGPAPLLVDAPGMIRGAVAAELLEALAQSASADYVLLLARREAEPALLAELAAWPRTLMIAPAADAARSPSKRQRAEQRTVLWDHYLAGADAWPLPLRSLAITGTPPPLDAAAAWVGRQVALLAAGDTLALGEVRGLEQGRLVVRAPRPARPVEALLVRDAARDDNGLLVTAHRPDLQVLTPASPPAADQPFSLRVGQTTLTLLNGVLGDPLLRLRLLHQRRSLLFDLGDAAHLPAAAMHEVSDVLITHAHVDHIAGFLWLLRARIGEFPPCRLYGPPGLGRHIAGLVRGVLWDRVEERGPVFLVHELHEGRVDVHRIQAGGGAEPVGSRPAPNGLLHAEVGFRLRAVALDHGFGTRSLAYAFEPTMQLNARQDRLAAWGLAPGRWLAELKRMVLGGERDAYVVLPDGSQERVGVLARNLLLEAPGARIVYATDFGDTPDNRARLIELARRAHTLACEASFLEADAERAAKTCHLTTRACGEIAAAAGVGQLLPFHFSRRYEDALNQVYGEIRRRFPRVLTPHGRAWAGGERLAE